VTTHRSFPRRFDALRDVFAFTAEIFAREAVDPGLLPTIDLAIEELFTNMIKYGPDGGGEVGVEIAAVAGGVQVTLTERDVDRFDVTAGPDADVDLPIEQRRPGGLGLHLVRHLVDSLRYEYSSETRLCRITFRKTLAGLARSVDGATAGEGKTRG
jgi:serine/threonine-protein kinase RsbW